MLDGAAVGGEHRAGERVGRRLIAQPKRLLHLVLAVLVHGHDGAEQLALHGVVERVGGGDDGGAHEVADVVVGVAAHQDVGVRRGLCIGDGGDLGVERAAIDHRAHEVAEIADVAHGDPGHLGLEPRADLRPEVGRRVDARARRALLALVLESAPDDGRRHHVGIGRRVHEDEVLAAGLPHDPRVRAVAVDVVADRAPHAVEDRCGAREVDAGEVGMRDDGIADLAARPQHEVDHARRQARLLEDLDEEVRREHGGRGRLQDDGVSHHRRSGREVPHDGGEVERRDGKDEALERPVLNAVPDAGRRHGLLGCEPRHVAHVEAPEVGKLAGGVDLGLVGGLGLPEHGGRVQRVAPRAGEEICSAQEDCGASLPAHRGPLLARVGGRGDGLLHLAGAAAVVGREHVLVVVRHDDLGEVPGAHLAAADDERDLDLAAGELIQPGLEARALRRSGRVAQNRLVHGGRDLEDSAHTVSLQPHSAVNTTVPGTGYSRASSTLAVPLATSVSPT